MDNEMDYDTGGTGNEMDYGGAAPGMPAAQNGFDAWNNVLASYANNPVAAQFGISTVQNWLAPSATVGAVGPASGPSGEAKTEDRGIIRSLLDGWKNLGGDDKKAVLSVATLLAGGLANIGKGKREQQAADALTLNATSNAARVAEEARQFDTKMANGSAIGQTNFGTAMQPLGMINAPVTLTRNRLRPTPGVTA